jgi:acyl-CoA synthetase (AMP-forming)/AMP-acid ligase II
VKLVVSGAAPISLTLLEKLRAKIPGIICESYGLSEATSVATISPATRDGPRLGSAGLPVQDTEIRIVDPCQEQIELSGFVTRELSAFLFRERGRHFGTGGERRTCASPDDEELSTTHLPRPLPSEAGGGCG